MEDIDKTVRLAGYQSFLGGMAKHVWLCFTLFIAFTLILWWISNMLAFQKDKISHLCTSANWIAFFYAGIYTYKLNSLNKANLLNYLPHPITLKVVSFIVLLLCVGSLAYLIFYRNNNLYVSKTYKIALIIGIILGLIFNKLICGSALLFFPTILVCLALIVWGVIKF